MEIFLYALSIVVTHFAMFYIGYFTGKERQAIKQMPVEIKNLALKCAIAKQYNSPCYIAITDLTGLEETYSIYWNSLGEFDPYFKRRNPITNFFRGIRNKKRRQEFEREIKKRFLNQ